MMATQEQQRDVWERFGWLWTAVYYAILIIVTFLAMGANETTPAERPLVLALVAVLAAWIGALALLDRRLPDLRQRSPLVAALTAVALAAWFWLTQITPIFFFMLFGLYPQLFIFHNWRWAVVMTIFLSTLIVIAQSLSDGVSITWGSRLIWYYGSLALGSVLLGLWINAISSQSARRRDLIKQLEATQADLAAAQRREGMLAERERLARDIHDTLAQGFTSIVMHLEAAEDALPGDVLRLQHHLDQARETARHSLEQARRVVQDLRPDLLEKRPLPEAITRLVTRWSAESQVAATAATTGDVQPLHPDVEVTLLRAAQEALANVRKHARAQHVAVTLSYIGDTVVLDIQDDGVGLNGGPPSPYSGGFGLQAMRERVRQLGGEVLLESEPGEGTTLVVSIPVPAP